MKNLCIKYKDLVNIAFLLVGTLILSLGVLLNEKIIVFVGVIFIGYNIFKLLDGKPTVILLLLLICADNFFSILPSNLKVGDFNFQISKLSLILLCFSYIYILKSKIMKKNLTNIKFKYNVAFGLAIVIISILNTYYNYEQSFVLSIFIQDGFLIYLIYFPLVIMFRKMDNGISIDKLMKWIVIISIIESFIYLIQYLLIDKFVFLHVNILERIGQARMLFSGRILIIGCIICIVQFFNKKSKQKNIYFIGFILNSIVIIFILKARMILLGLTVSITIYMIIAKNIKKTTLIYVITPIIALTVYFGRDYIYEMIRLTTNEISKSSGNYGVRLQEIEFFLEQVEGKELIGRGILTPKTRIGELLEGKSRGYYINDIGIIGFYVYYGLLGCIWYITFIITIIKQSIQKINNKRIICYEALIFGIFLFVVITTLAELYFKSEFVIVFMILLQAKSDCLSNRN